MLQTVSDKGESDKPNFSINGRPCCERCSSTYPLPFCMNAKFPVLIFAAWVTCSCVSTPFASRLSPQAAQAEARRDIRSRSAKIYLAGTRGVYEVGVPESARPFVESLPRSHKLPAGCTPPDASVAVNYATAYNEEIVRYFSGPQRHTESKP
jgi:hypothetical protein